MKFFKFYRESDDFEDILKDASIKKSIDLKISWNRHLIIGLRDESEQTQSLITLKYGDDMISDLVKDFTPVPGVDYIPKKDSATFTKASS